MTNIRRRIALVQLPIPPPGLDPMRGNVPLAAGYLKLCARQRGLESAYDIDIFPPALANTLGDAGLVAALLARDPWFVGFTCYVWNVERTLWIAARLKERRPDLRVVLGGPEITADNAWVLDSPQVDFAVIGAGEQTFADLLEALRQADEPRATIPGLLARDPSGRRELPPPRLPWPRLDDFSSPYLAGILDMDDERLFFLETSRGCAFRCKFCYYPKSYDQVYFLSADKIVANLQHAHQHGAREVILLDPTLNQRGDLAGFLRLLARCNPGRQFTYFGELRAEGIDTETAALLRAANFTEVEIGLQSVDPVAERLMNRRSNRRAFERGVRALLDAGIHVKVDLIVGLPGDTPESVRRGLHYVHDGGLYSGVQVFDLAILPGTAFRHEAAALGLEFQKRPPYHVVRTPTLRHQDLYELMAEAEDLFTTEFEPLPAPRLPAAAAAPDAPATTVHTWKVDLDLAPAARAPRPPAERRAQAFTLWLRADDLARHGDETATLVRDLLTDCPHTTLQVVLEPRRTFAVTSALLEHLRAACYAETSYLDLYYAFLPGPMKGAKRLVLLLPLDERGRLGSEWIDTMAEHAAVVWRGTPDAATDLQAHEFVIAP